MKKILLLAVMFITLTASAQSSIIKPVVNTAIKKIEKIEKAPNTIVTATGNYQEKVDVKLNKTYTSAEGKTFDVYQNKTGKLYIITGISEKTGKPKKKYLII